MSGDLNAAGAGCLGRVFTLIGLFIIATVVLGAFAMVRDGGDFEFVGGLIPALGFLVAGASMSRRVKRAREVSSGGNASRGRAPRTRTQPTAPPPPPPSSIPPTLPGPTTVSTPPPPRSVPSEDRRWLIDEEATVSPVDEVARALDEGGKHDLTTGQLSSEERLRIAREKYLPRRPGGDGYDSDRATDR